MNKQTAKKIFEALQKHNPDPKIELSYSNPFELLVAVVLSAQATDVGVNKATPALFKVANTPQKMIELGENNLKKYIKTIGLYNSKAKNIIKASKMLVEKFNEKLPETREELETIPGVGRKTANVILNSWLGKSYIGVDTHVFRVANRTGLAKGKTPLDVEEQLEKIIPENFKKSAGHQLVLHGRYICKAKTPLCPTCPINSWCEWALKCGLFLKN
jgi:endonuclease-3